MNPIALLKVIFFDLGDTLVFKNNSSQWIPHAQRTLHQLQGKGIRLGLISNTGNLMRPDLLKQLPKDFDLRMFDADLIILSSEAGIEKPRRGIFRLALQRAKVEPHECLFCDDELHNTLCAQVEGMLTARVRSPTGDQGQSASDIGGLIEELESVGFLHR